jgi:hypothetical protein
MNDSAQFQPAFNDVTNIETERITNVNIKIKLKGKLDTLGNQGLKLLTYNTSVDQLKTGRFDHNPESR